MMPLVSCICITQNRRLFLRRAVSYFEKARSEFLRSCPKGDGWCELIVIDGSESSQKRLYIDGLFLDEVAGIRYFHEPSPPGKMGTKRNRACELARGDILLHWDDDDWQPPDRIAKQVQSLEDRKRDIVQVAGMPKEGAFCFTSQFYAYHLTDRRAARWRSWGRGGTLGATFAYHRKAWEAAAFRDVDLGEDNFFWDDQIARGTAMVDMKDPSLMVYMRHNQNCSPVISEGATDADTEAARGLLGVDLPFYDELSEILPLHESPHARWKETWERQQLQRFAAQRRHRF